jgi:hypothetical protein
VPLMSGCAWLCCTALCTVADYVNNRVLSFPSGSTIATQVWGQDGRFTTRFSGVSATTLTAPVGLALDSTGGLYVAEFYNHRVLFFPAGSFIATRVYGQNGSFISSMENYPSGTPSATSLRYPVAMALDSTGGLYGQRREATAAAGARQSNHPRVG